MKNFVLYVVATTLGFTLGWFTVGGFDHNGNDHKHSNIVECHCKNAEQKACCDIKDHCCKQPQASPACTCERKNGIVECDCWGKSFCDCQAKWPAIWIAGNKVNNELNKLNARIDEMERKLQPKKIDEVCPQK